MVLHMEHMSLQLKTLQERQNRIVDSILEDKTKMIDQANGITLEMLTRQQQVLNFKGQERSFGEQPDLLPHKDPLALPGSDTTIDAKDTEEHDR